MDETTKDGFKHTSPQTVRVLTSHLSPKRRRTDWANSCTETFHKTVCGPSSASTLLITADLVRTDKCRVIEDEEPYGTAVIVDLIANLSASHARDAPPSSPEGCPPPLLTEEQLQDAEFVELCQHLCDDAGGELAESQTLPDRSTDASNHSDCKLRRESLEDSHPAARNLPPRNGHEGQRQVVSSVSDVQASKCSWNTWRPAEHEEMKMKMRRYIVLSRNEEEVENSSVPCSHSSDKNLFYPNIEDIPSGNFAEGVKNEGDKLELQICGNGDVAPCETKGGANGNGVSRNTIRCAAQCAKGSTVSYDVASAGKIATESVGLKADVLCGAEGERAAGEMIAKAGRKEADHPAETPPPAGISQEHAGGDNDAGRFSVIDPAIWRETDRESGGTRCYSESRTVADLFPSVKVCETETPPALGADITPRPWNHRGEVQECKEEKDSPWPPHTAPLACPNSNDRKEDKTVEESSSELPAVAVEHLLKVQTHSGCFPVSSDELKTQEDDAQVKIVCDDEGTQANVTEKLSSEEHDESPSPMDLDQILGQFGQYGNNSVHINEGHDTEWVFDHTYSTAFPLIEEIAEDNGDSSVDGEVNTLASMMPEDVHGSPNRATEKPQDKMSNGTSDSLPVGPPERESESICFFDCRLTEETVAVECVTSGDAVVPSESTPSLKTRNDPATQNGTDGSSLLSVQLDCFQRIQLSLGDDGCSGDSSRSVLFTTSIGDAETANEQEVIPEKEQQEGEKGEEKVQHQTTDTANWFPKSDSSRNEVRDLTKPGAPALKQAGSQTTCSFSASWSPPVDVQDDLDPRATISSRPASDSNHLPKFEMKKQFDMVLRELNLYFAISMSDFTSAGCKESPSERPKDATEATGEKTLGCEDEELSGRKLKHQGDTLLGEYTPHHTLLLLCIAKLKPLTQHYDYIHK